MMKCMSLTGIAGLTAILIFSSLFFFNCSGKETDQARNLEQIYKEEGVPVRTEMVTEKSFKTELSFNAVLKGIKESSAYASIGDKVEKIHVKVGDFVKKDDVLLTFPTDSPSAQYNQARVAFQNAEAAYKRIENLYKSGGISLQERDNARAAYEVNKANWEAARQSVKVKAPISGYVTRISVSETDNTRRDDELFTISQTDRLKAQVWISESHIFEIKEGMAAVAEWQEFSITGKIVQVDMAMNQQRKAFQALVEFDNPDNLFKPGTTAEIKIVTADKPGAIVVKRQHIVREQGKPYIYVVQEGQAVKKEITTGNQHVLEVEVLSGLTPGDELVIEGQTLLEPGQKVKIIK